MIDVKNLWHHFQIKPILKDINLTINKGELLCIMGSNGCGKSTLLSTIGGLINPLKGEVYVNEIKRWESEENEMAVRKNLYYLPYEQYFPIFPTGREYLYTVGDIYGIDSFQVLEHIESLAKLYHFEKVIDSSITNYSTGQKKKLAIASALISEVDTFILDEPFSGGLDSSALNVTARILKELADNKDKTVLMAVPVPELVEPIADRVAIMHEGEIIACDSPANLCKENNCETLNDVLEHYLNPDMESILEGYLK
ncbi:MAG: ABC transporter ATP-binding protein [Lentisphaeria bacterium]|nr:ABC transporter ATP-binding protein [Lentisphaeria bacterium]